MSVFRLPCLMRTSISIVSVLGILAFTQPPLRAQEKAPGSSETFREFTNKDGRTVQARIVSVSSDRRTIRIAPRNGQEAQLPIVDLVLEDQQFLKTWLKRNSALTDYQLKVDIERTSTAAKDRRRQGDDRFHTAHAAYQVTIRNVSRQTLNKPSVEYLVVKAENIRISQDPETGRWIYSSRSPSLPDGETSLPELTRGDHALEDLIYNRDQVFTTTSVELDEVLRDGNDVYGEDELLGVLVRVRDEFGNLIGTFRSEESRIRNMTWEELTGDPIKEPETKNSSPTTPSSPAPLRNELTELPDLFQKGDFLSSRLAPRIEGKPIRIRAIVDIDDANPEGTIFAFGGKNKGYGIVVAQGSLQFWIRRHLGKPIHTRLSVPLSVLPQGEFRLEATNTSELATLTVDGDPVAKDRSIGLLDTRPIEGLSIGFDSEVQAVGPGSTPDPFAGTIRDVRIDLGR